MYNVLQQIELFGYTQEAATIIEESLNEALQGTTVRRTDFAPYAVQAFIAAGLQERTQLTRHLKAITDALAITQAEIEKMCFIFNIIACADRVPAATAQELADLGLPLFRYMNPRVVEKGQVSYKEFLFLVEDNIGGAAVIMANTFRGKQQIRINNLSDVVDEVKEVYSNTRNDYLAKLKPNLEKQIKEQLFWQALGDKRYNGVTCEKLVVRYKEVVKQLEGK